MPIFRIGQQLHYYAHIPKCGGSSVEQYLSDRFGALGFYNRQFHAVRTEPERWSKTSAQHVDWATLTSLVPEAWIASAFTVVRHPVARAVSSFQFQRDVEGLIGADETFDDWFSRWVDERSARLYAFDNHLRPQSDIAPAWATVFPLEAGLDALVPYLDGLAGDEGGARSIPFTNKSKGDHAGARPVPSERTLRLIGEVYAEDFRRYGYRIGEAALAGAPAAPQRPQPGAETQIFRRATRRLRRLLT